MATMRLSVTSVGEVSVATRSPRRDFMLQERYLRFKLHVGFIEDGRIRTATSLKLGETYDVRVFVSEANDRIGDEEYWFSSDGDVIVALTCTNIPDAIIELGSTEFATSTSFIHAHIREDQLCIFPEIDFRLCVPLTVSASDVELELTGDGPDLTGLMQKSLAHHYLPLSGDRLRVNRNIVVGQFNARLEQALPEHMAMLYVGEPQKGKLQIEGWNPKVPWKGSEVICAKPDGASLAQRIDNKLSPTDIFAKVVQMVEEILPLALLQWVKKLAQRYPDQLCVVIRDATDSEIPWEMLYFDRCGFLGEVAEVVRWIDIRNSGELVKLETEEQILSGEILAHLDANQEDTRIETAELRQLNAYFSEDLPQALQEVETNAARYALVYIACHGFFRWGKEEKERFQILSTQDNPSGKILDYDLYLYKRPNARLPFFVINACHSGRLLRDTKGVFGLPQVFLARLAQGYIGTLGAVDQKMAAELGAEVIRALGIGMPGRLSRVLRDMRRRALAGRTIADLRRADRAAAERVLFAFMYVYFGQPYASLAAYASSAQEPPK
jgi:hypothetical protein